MTNQEIKTLEDFYRLETNEVSGFDELTQEEKEIFEKKFEAYKDSKENQERPAKEQSKEKAMTVEQSMDGKEGNNNSFLDAYKEVIAENGCKLGEKDEENGSYPVLDDKGTQVARIKVKDEDHIAMQCGTEEKDLIRFKELIKTAHKQGFDSINFSEKNSPEFNALLARACAEHEPPLKTLGYEAKQVENAENKKNQEEKSPEEIARQERISKISQLRTRAQEVQDLRNNAALNGGYISKEDEKSIMREGMSKEQIKERDEIEKARDLKARVIKKGHPAHKGEQRNFDKASELIKARGQKLYGNKDAGR